MSNDKRVPDRVSKGVPTGGQFATSARGESTVTLAGAPDGPVTSQAVIDAARDHLVDATASHDLSGRMADAAPALAETGALREHGFKDQFLYPLVTAIHTGNDDEAQCIAQRIVDLETADQAYLDSGWTPPGVDITDRDNIHGARHTGSLYDSTRPLTEVAKIMRADFKAAQVAGYLPDDLTFRVTTDSSGNGAINITIEGLPDERAFWRNPDSQYKSPGARFHTQPSWEALRLRDRVDGIGAAYAYSQSNGMTDFMNVSHHVFSTVESERSAMSRRHEKEQKAMERRIKAAERGEIPLETVNRELAEQSARHRAERDERAAANRKWDW